ncbi:MAG: histidine biosynthesis protein [Betaproteobacteria bacterium]|nr:histidine biosynthesis protein [Betaproteobacteria bacterium]
MLDIIPVIDLLNGQVVHARRGDRQHYASIRSGLCDSADPDAIVDALLGVHPFRTLYIADLDAIQGRGDHGPVIERLHARHPELTLWVDAGLSRREALLSWRARGLGMPIVGAESLPDLAAFSVIAGHLPPEAWILSMDFRGETFLGPCGLIESAQDWPRRVLAMNLARVGSGEGADLDLIQRLGRAAPGSAVYAAGGVREADDLLLIERTGATGALIATALHDGRISAASLRQYQGDRSG